MDAQTGVSAKPMLGLAPADGEDARGRHGDDPVVRASIPAVPSFSPATPSSGVIWTSSSAVIWTRITSPAPSTPAGDAAVIPLRPRPGAVPPHEPDDPDRSPSGPAAVRPAVPVSAPGNVRRLAA
ncbi:hypothetical protein [Nonomuraea roseola]|uniref:Uncharacterized protein n=1 Tax=Nonomuraea roseola TaxID=46179 RepID=A0ABV5PRP1_9ACTN